MLSSVSHNTPRWSNQVELKSRSASQVKSWSSPADKENECPNPRSLLKTSEHKQGAKKKALSVRFDIPPTEEEIQAAQMDETAETAINTLIHIWAKQFARTRDAHKRYVDRVVFNFQPGMTARYLKYLLEHVQSPKSIEDDRLTEPQREKLVNYAENFDKMKQRIIIVDKMNINSAEIKASITEDDDNEPSIIIVQCEDDPANGFSSFNALIKKLKRSKHSLIVFAAPLYGLRSYRLERLLNAKIRNLVLPRFLRHLKNHNKHCGYNFNSKQFEACHGVPVLLELARLQATEDQLRAQLFDSFALWKRPLYSQFMGYYCSLFNLVKSGIQITSATKLPSSKLTVVDAAAMLGFEVSFSVKGRTNSDGKEQDTDVAETIPVTSPTKYQASRVPSINNSLPHSVRAIATLKAEFEKDYPHFDAFTLLRADNLKWLELEKAIARAMTNFKGLTPLKDRWCFLKGSFVGDIVSSLTLAPQVVPQVKKNGSALDLKQLKIWSNSTREIPSQKTMRPRDWPEVYAELQLRRTILPVEKSRSPDCMYRFVDELLCFQAKSGVQDLSMKNLKKEVAKCPFLTYDRNNKQIRRTSEGSDIKITFVYLAQCHSTVKLDLLGDNYDPENNDQKTINSVTKFHEYIHIAEGNSVLPLPHNVEVIVLLRAGIEALLGKEGYDTLVDPLSEITQLVKQEKQSDAMQIARDAQKIATMDQAIAEMQALYERAKHIDGAADALVKEIERLKSLNN